jgi:hypothetical protein
MDEPTDFREHNSDDAPRCFPRRRDGRSREENLAHRMEIHWVRICKLEAAGEPLSDPRYCRAVLKLARLACRVYKKYAVK